MAKKESAPWLQLWEAIRTDTAEATFLPRCFSMPRQNTDLACVSAFFDKLADWQEAKDKLEMMILEKYIKSYTH